MRSRTVGGRTFLAAALCGAIVAWATPSSADDLVPSLSVQTGVTYIRSPGQDSDDYFVAATPSLTYFIDGERVDYAITYSFTGSLNSELPNAIANRLALATATELSPTTRLLLGAEALQSMIGNYLLVRRSAQTQIGGLPPLNTQLLTITLSQGIAHELSPVLRLTQSVSGTYVTSLDPDVIAENYLATASVGLSRSWQFDAVGGEINAQYANTWFPPQESTAMTVAAGPTWDHDLTPNLTTSLAVSAQVAFSPDPGTKARVGPQGLASLFYTNEGYGVEASYSYGITPNVLLGTLIEAHQATVRGVVPLSRRADVAFGVSAGYLWAKNVDLQTNGQLDNQFDAVLHDADLTWGATDFLSTFIRYQFIGQSSGTGPAASPPLVRHAAILGVDLFGSRRAVRQRARVPSRFPQRVDATDQRPSSSSRSSSPSPR
jgi:hypothetical protein